MKELAFFKDYLLHYQPYQTYWNYEDGCVLTACEYLYRATGDGVYRDFILTYLDPRVTDAGEIPNYEGDTFNIDSINCGKVLFFALKETGNKKYRRAIRFIMERLQAHPRCACGNFWHKSIYPSQIWLDGLYMAQPFYMAYEAAFNGYARVDDIAAQFATVRKRMFNAEKGLYYHAYDEARQQPWHNPVTGCSPNFWLRAEGWLLMAMADCIDLCADRTAVHQALCAQLDEALRGILRWRDEKTGLFHQIIDRADVAGNYLETSGSAMVAYALMKGARIGAIDASFAETGLSVYDNLITQKLREADGALCVCDICKVGGVGPGEKRDGSVAYYLSEPIVMNDSKGVGPVMMATSEAILARK